MVEMTSWNQYRNSPEKVSVRRAGTWRVTSLHADRIPVLPVVRCGDVATVYPHRHLCAAELGVESRRNLYLVAARPKALDRLDREIPFDRDGGVVVHHAPARGVAGGLRVLAVVSNA